MPIGKNYGNESIEYTDDITGAHIRRLTSHPTINTKLYMHVNQCTPDSKTIVYCSRNELTRDGYDNLYRVDINGENNIRLTDRPGISGFCVDDAGRFVYLISRRGILSRINLSTFVEEDVSFCEEQISAGVASITDDNRYYYTDGFHKNGVNACFVHDIKTGKGRTLYMNKPGEWLTHVQHDPSGAGYVAFQVKLDIYIIDSITGELIDKNLTQSNGHWGWLGKTGLIFTNCMDCHNYMATYDIKTKKFNRFTYGDRIYCHGGGSADGKWVVSDTHWPPEGVYLINVATGKSSMVSHMHTLPGHPQWTHPHPSLTPDNKYVLYNSNKDGFMHIYAAEITDSLRSKLENTIYPDQIY